MLGEPAQPRAEEDPRLFRCAQPHALGENIVAARFNAPQQTAIDPRQRPERGTRVGVHVKDQFHAFAVKRIDA